jgi:tetratricopeptide (TPR) repeat protein
LVRDAVEVEALEPLRVKGKGQPVAASRLLSVQGLEGLARRFDAPMVGRTDELRSLTDALGRAERDRACVLVTVLGPAGVGKSRLVQEFLEHARGSARLVLGRCLPYGQGITYWPVVEMVTVATEIADLDGPDDVRGKIAALLGRTDHADLVVERVAQLLGVADATAAPEETHWAIRRLFEALATSGPLVAVFDDIHWGEPALLDLIEHIADWSRDTPILVLCLARPDLLDRRPGWGGGKLNAASFLLEPLSDTESEQLVANLLEHASLPPEARRTITDAAEGNPLFVEQMVAMLIDDGMLMRQGDRWVAVGDLSSVTPPPSIMALLEARLERLGPAERAVIERASIEGKQFHVGSVRALSDDGAGVQEPLMALVRRDLIRPDRSVFAGDDAFRFRNILIRDAAYRRIPKETRAELHQRHADWLLGVAHDRLSEFEEFVGYHLEQAFRLRSELGPLDLHSADLASQASTYLLAGARRASDRGDYRASSSLLSRGIQLLPEDHHERPTLLAELSLMLGETGDTERARSVIDEAEAALARAPDPSLEIRVRFAQLELDAKMQPEGVAARMKDVADRAIPRLEAIGDHEGLSMAWQLIGEANLFWTNLAGMLEAFGRAREQAELAGDPRPARTTVWSAIVLWSSETPVEQALAELDALAADVESDLGVTAWFEVGRGMLFAMSGRIDEGRDLVRRGRGRLEDLGQTMTVGGSAHPASTLEEWAGDLEAAEREARRGYELLASLGEKGFLSTVVGMLARLVAMRGSLEEAEELARIGEEAAASDDLFSQVLWRQARALVHARRGEDTQALALALEAVRIAEPTDDCAMRSSVYDDLATVYGFSGHTTEAAAALRRAIDLWDRRGASFLADRYRAKLAEVTDP